MELFRTSTNTYIVDLTPRTWAAAKTYAESINVSLANKSTGHAALAVIETAAEQATVSTQVLSLAKTSTASAEDGGGARYIWLGGSDVATEGSWVWVNGNPITYANWGTGSMWQGSGQSSEPDNYQNQDALAMGLQTWPNGSSPNNGLGDAGQWNDIRDSNTMPSLIELPADATRVTMGNRHVALDVDGNAGIAVKIIGAVFGKATIANGEWVGIGIGIDLLDKGMSYDALAGLALNAAKLTTNDQIVTTLWTNVVGSAPTAADKAPFIKMLEDGMTPGALAHMAAETTLNVANVDLVGLAQTGVVYTPVV